MAQRIHKAMNAEVKDLLATGSKYLDVRTEEEYVAGHIAGSVNAPFMLQSPEGMQPNPHFLEAVKAAFPDPAVVKLVVGCRSGNRSARACVALRQEGYVNIVDHAEGYSGWTAAALPITRCFNC